MLLHYSRRALFNVFSVLVPNAIRSIYLLHALFQLVATRKSMLKCLTTVFVLFIVIGKYNNIFYHVKNNHPN